MKKVFIKSIAAKYKIMPEDILIHLAGHNILLATVPNAKLLIDTPTGTQKVEYDAVDIPISEEVVLCIAANGMWQGDKITIWHTDTKIQYWKNWTTDKMLYDGTIIEGGHKITSSQVIFKESISLTNNHLFVYEQDFSNIEQEISGIAKLDSEQTAQTDTAPAPLAETSSGSPESSKKEVKGFQMPLSPLSCLTGSYYRLTTRLLDEAASLTITPD